MKQIALLLALLPTAAFAQSLDCPPADRPVADHANLLGAAAADRLAQVCRKLQEEERVPLVVVTIPSMREHGGDGMDIGRFAALVLAQWRFDGVESDGRDWDRAVLFLVSRGDRKCRIEPGAKLDGRRLSECEAILRDQVLPRFRSGDFAGGIENGVLALDATFRGTKPPSRPRRGLGIGWILGTIALGVFSVVSLVRRGSQGAAWGFWRAVFSVLSTVMLILATSRGHRRRGWGYGRTSGFGGGFGGSFTFGGGGSRGGGVSRSGRGVTGSW